MKYAHGIVGHMGDLGSRMSKLCMSHRLSVFGHDITQKDNTIHYGQHMINDVDITELLRYSHIVHWCASSREIQTVNEFMPHNFVIFHDSVMSSSLKHALKAKESNGLMHFAIVHCLMNEDKKVIVASDVGNPEEVVLHLKTLGMDVVSMTHDEHDTIMARSQAITALLTDALLADLQVYRANGLLTPSATELEALLAHRKTQWTPASVDTILSNPQLPSLLQELSTFIKIRQTTNKV